MSPSCEGDTYRFFARTVFLERGRAVFAIDRIPDGILDILRARDIDANAILLAAHADRTREHTVGDEYLFATSGELIVLHNGARAIDAPDLTIYQVQDLRGFAVEELLSSGRLTARKSEDNTPVLIAAFTNFCKESMFLFAKYANKIAAGEEVVIDEKDDPAAKQCPKCGLRYPDLNRRICPHCMEKGKLFRRFSVFLMRYRISIIITLLSLAAMTALSILAPYLSSGFFYDEVIFGVGEFAGQILLVLGLIIATRLLKTFVTMVNNYVTSRIAAKMVFDLKKTIFSSIERLSLSFFTGRQTGGLMTQINEDANTIYSFFCDGVPYMLINIVQVAVLPVLHPVAPGDELALQGAVPAQKGGIFRPPPLQLPGQRPKEDEQHQGPGEQLQRPAAPPHQQQIAQYIGHQQSQSKLIHAVAAV
jgi:ATP-binding cassette subfamily B protein